MTFAVHLGNRAQKSLKRIPEADRRRIMAALDAMQADPLEGDVVKLKGTDAFRRRVGDYRILFNLDFKAAAVGVFDILRRTSGTYR